MWCIFQACATLLPMSKKDRTPMLISKHLWAITPLGPFCTAFPVPRAPSWFLSLPQGCMEEDELYSPGTEDLGLENSPELPCVLPAHRSIFLLLPLLFPFFSVCSCLSPSPSSSSTPKLITDGALSASYTTSPSQHPSRHVRLHTIETASPRGSHRMTPEPMVPPQRTSPSVCGQ